VSGIDERDLPSGTGPEPEVDGAPPAPTERPAGFWDDANSRPAEQAGSGWPTTPAEIPLVDQPPIDEGRGWSEAAPPPPRHRHSRNPVDRLTRGLPDPLRVIVDWAVTIVGAVAIVLLVKAYVVNPYRIPSSSMEPTLHCAQPASGCEARFSDRVLANRFIFHLRDPRRGEIVVFETPDAARVKCGATIARRPATRATGARSRAAISSARSSRPTGRRTAFHCAEFPRRIPACGRGGSLKASASRPQLPTAEPAASAIIRRRPTADPLS